MNATIIVRGEPRRFRYILCGLVNYDGPISDYRLIGANNLNDAASCIRFKLPNNFHLTKYSCDSYSTTDDKRTLNEIGYDVLVKINGRWVVRNDLKGIQPHTIYKAMMKEGLSPVKKMGYMNHAQYKAYYQNRDKKIRAALTNGELPNEPEFANKYALVWHDDDGSMGYSLYEHDFEMEISKNAMDKVGIKTTIIKPKKPTE